MARLSPEDAAELKEMQEKEELDKNPPNDRDRKEKELLKTYTWRKTSPRNYYQENKSGFIEYIKKLHDYSVEEFKKYYEKYNTLGYFSELLERLTKEEEDKITEITNSLKGLSPEELEYIRLKVIEAMPIHGCEPYKKNIHYLSDKTEKVLYILEKTEIGNNYPEFKNVFSSKDYRKKCFNENYLDKVVFACSGSANFKAFIDSLFSLYDEFCKLDKEKAEEAIVKTINAALNLDEPCLLIIKKENDTYFSISPIFFAKEGGFRFYLPEGYNTFFIKKDVNNDGYILDKDIELADIKESIENVYKNKKVLKYKVLAKKLLGIFVKSKILEKKPAGKKLCTKCQKEPCYGHKSVCKNCYEKREIEARQKGVRPESIKRNHNRKNKAKG